MWHKLLWLAGAGALGTLARYGLGGLVQRSAGGLYPWGTLVVNTLGCLLFGVVWSLAEERLLISGEVRRIVLTGFFGAFTTFSSFAFETSSMLRESEWLLAGSYVLVQTGLGLVLMRLGMAAGRWL